MKWHLEHILNIIACLTLPGTTFADTNTGNSLRGAIGAAIKYDPNINLDLGPRANPSTGDLITQALARLSLRRSLSNKAWLETRLSGVANWHVEHADKNWYFGRARLSAGYNLGKNELGFSNELRSYTVPKEKTTSFLRNTAILNARRTLSPRWQLNLGYGNIATFYPDNDNFNYVMNGAFLEIRNTWDFAFSTYYAYDLQSYQGRYNAELNDPTASPEEGSRHTFKLGFDWVFNRNVLNGSYFFQIDRSRGEGLSQIGGFEGDEESLDTEAEFDFVKHKATLLYSRRLTPKLSLSSYEELIFKNLSQRDHPTLGLLDRNHTLFLSSTSLTYKLRDDWVFKIRYLFRTRQSSVNTEDYKDHLFFLGAEYRF